MRTRRHTQGTFLGLIETGPGQPEYIEPDFDTSPAIEVREYRWTDAPAELREHFAATGEYRHD